MRIGRLAVAATAAFAAAVMAGCTSAEEPTIPSAGGLPGATTASEDPGAQELEFVACMREAGIEDMPDPVPGDTSGRSAVRYAIDVLGKGSDPVFQAALDGCLDLLPPPPPVEPRSPDEVEALHQFARCMRDHGLTDFPDPQGDNPQLIFLLGHPDEPLTAVTTIDGVVSVNLGDPVAAAAWEACQPLFPSSPDE